MMTPSYQPGDLQPGSNAGFATQHRCCRLAAPTPTIDIDGFLMVFSNLSVMVRDGFDLGKNLKMAVIFYKTIKNTLLLVNFSCK